MERFAADGNPVQAAFWVKTAEEGIWFLYVVTDLIDREGPAAAYRAVHYALNQFGTSWISSSEIKVIGPNNPIAEDVLAVMTRHPGRLATRFGGKMLGSMAVDQTYLYPPHFFTFSQANPMTTEEIGREVVRLMNRGPGILQPSRVALRDGTAFTGVPFSLEIGAQQAMVARFLADGESAPRVVQIDAITSIN